MPTTPLRRRLLFGNIILRKRIAKLKSTYLAESFMTTALGVTERIKTLNELQSRFSLQPASSDSFFNEWLTDLPELSSAQVLGLERLKNRYDYHRTEGLLLEGTINTVVLAPLMELAGFLDPPFRLKSPMLVSPQPEQPVYGMATNGDEFVFLKVLQSDSSLYDTSRTFSLFPRRHELGEILKILTHLGSLVTQ